MERSTRTCTLAQVGAIALGALLQVGCGGGDVSQLPDGQVPDQGLPDLGTLDSGGPDLGAPDAEAPDQGMPDLGSSDSGTPDMGPADLGTDAGPWSPVIVSAVVGSVVERGSTATFTVQLASMPSTTVGVPLNISGADASLSATGLVFNASDWNQPKTVTIAAVDDWVIDGIVPVVVTVGPAVSGDPVFSGAGLSMLNVSVLDDDVADIVARVASSGLCDFNGARASIGLKLASQPAGSVTVPLPTAPSGDTQWAVSSVVFDATTWDVEQFVDVTWTGSDLTGASTTSLPFGTPTSSDFWYAAATLTPLTVSVCDGGNADLLIQAVGATPLTLPLQTSETGQSTSFEVSLTTAPSGPVTLTLSATVAGEVMFSTTQLMFDASTWSTPQAVTVTGIDDMTVNGSATFELRIDAMSIDPAYDSHPDWTIPIVNSSAPQNVALGAPLTVFECGPMCACPASSLTDGSAATTCYLYEPVTDFSPEPWVEIDLGAEYDLVSLAVNCTIDAQVQHSEPTVSVRRLATDPWVALTGGGPWPMPGTIRYVAVATKLPGVGIGFLCNELVAMAVVN